MDSIRERLNNALASQQVTHPVYVVYDLFYNRWDLDWDMLFGLGLGQINHANILVQVHHKLFSLRLLPPLPAS